MRLWQRRHRFTEIRATGNLAKHIFPKNLSGVWNTSGGFRFLKNHRREGLRFSYKMRDRDCRNLPHHGKWCKLDFELCGIHTGK